MKPVLTDAQVDALLDSVLRASGSALSNYTFKKTLDAMREAVREIERAVCQHRGEPVATVRSVSRNGVKINWLGGFPQIGDRLYLIPQPTTPEQEPSDSEIMWEWANTKNTGDMRIDLVAFARALLARYGQTVEPGNGCECNQGQSCQVCDPVLEPVKVPSDDDIRRVARDMYLAGELTWIGFDRDENGEYTQPTITGGDITLFRALLARYGRLATPAQEPGFKVRERGFIYENGNHTPTLLLAFPIGDWDSRDRLAAMLAAAPKFGEEE